MITLVLIFLAACIALLTWSVGWWAVLVAGVVVGAVWRARVAARVVALAAAVSWLSLLFMDAGTGRLFALARELGGVFRVPGVVLVLFTLLFAAAGSWSAAVVAGALVRIGSRAAEPGAVRVRE